MEDFNELENRPKYAGSVMTGNTNIPEVVLYAGTGENVDGPMTQKATTDAIESETTARELADVDLSDRIDDEEATRENLGINLQGQIDALSVASDVTDVVGDKAALNNYDTSKLKDNDIVKVLQDESENDQITYYRWNSSTSAFSLIGSEGPYYTKADSDTLLNAKQDTLIAGSNIAIGPDGKTISATDTTYSDFVGADSTTAGIAGLVPAPTIADASKFLKGDGTWGNAGGGDIVNATSSSTDVLDVKSLLDDNPNAKFFSIVATNAHRFGWGSQSQSGSMPLINTNNELMVVRFSNGYLLFIDVAKSSLAFYKDFGTTLSFQEYVLNRDNVIDNLTTTIFNNYNPNTLSAKQGKVLNDKITDLEQRIAALEGN